MRKRRVNKAAIAVALLATSSPTALARRETPKGSKAKHHSHIAPSAGSEALPRGAAAGVGGGEEGGGGESETPAAVGSEVVAAAAAADAVVASALAEARARTGGAALGDEDTASLLAEAEAWRWGYRDRTADGKKGEAHMGEGTGNRNALPGLRGVLKFVRSGMFWGLLGCVFGSSQRPSRCHFCNPPLFTSPFGAATRAVGLFWQAASGSGPAAAQALATLGWLFALPSHAAPPVSPPPRPGARSARGSWLKPHGDGGAAAGGASGAGADGSSPRAAWASAAVAGAAPHGAFGGGGGGAFGTGTGNAGGSDSVNGATEAGGAGSMSKSVLALLKSSDLVKGGAAAAEVLSEDPRDLDVFGAGAGWGGSGSIGGGIGVGSGGGSGQPGAALGAYATARIGSPTGRPSSGHGGDGGGQRDLAMALALWRRAASAGSPEGQHAVAAHLASPAFLALPADVDKQADAVSADPATGSKAAMAKAAAAAEKSGGLDDLDVGDSSLVDVGSDPLSPRGDGRLLALPGAAETASVAHGYFAAVGGSLGAQLGMGHRLLFGNGVEVSLAPSQAAHNSRAQA